MTRKWVLFYLANWYAFAASGVMLSLQSPTSDWLASLPWASWGTEWALALTQGELVSGGAAWILLGVGLTAVGAGGSLLACLLWLAREAESAATRGQRPAAPAQTRDRAGPSAVSIQGSEAVDLVEDPRLRRLIQQLTTRLG